jgi:hypothetical protein
MLEHNGCALLVAMQVTSADSSSSSGGGSNTATSAAGSSPRQFAAQVYAAGSAGGALVQRSSLFIINSRFGPANSAAFEAGGLLISQPVAMEMRNSSITGNVALGGGGGGAVVRGAGVQLCLTSFGQVEFSKNQAVLDGGAVLLDSALGICKAAFHECVFMGNVAGQYGGSVAANGPAEVACNACDAYNSSAGASGGWLSCTGCATVSVFGSSNCSNCRAVQAGGVISCDRCGSLVLSNLVLTNNSAGSGGAVAAQATRNIELTGGVLEQNAAGLQQQQQQLSSRRNRNLMAYEAAAAAGISQWPGLWRGMYQNTLDASGSGCSSGGGLGGALCLAEAGSARIDSSILRRNTAARGGAVAASAACPSSSSSCVVQLSNITTQGNAARDAAGFLYTSTPQAIQWTDASTTSNQQQQQQQQQQVLLDQLQQDNSVAEGGYGPGVASSPTSLSLLGPMQITGQQLPGDIDSKLPSSSVTGRKLLQNIEPPAALGIQISFRGVGRMLLPLLGSARSKGAVEVDSVQAWVESQVEQLLGPQAGAAAAGEQGGCWSVPRTVLASGADAMQVSCIMIGV